MRPKCPAETTNPYPLAEVAGWLKLPKCKQLFFFFVLKLFQNGKGKDGIYTDRISWYLMSRFQVTQNGSVLIPFEISLGRCNSAMNISIEQFGILSSSTVSSHYVWQMRTRYMILTMLYGHACGHVVDIAGTFPFPPNHVLFLLLLPRCYYFCDA